MEQRLLIEKLYKYCKDFSQTISSNMIWNLNDSANVKETIDKSSAPWRKFVNEVDTYFKLYPNNEKQREINMLITRPIIDANWVQDAEVFLNSLESELLIQSKQVESRHSLKTELENLISETPKIEKCFQIKGGNGIPEVRALRGNSTFEKWRAALQFQFRKLKQDKNIDEILVLLDSFNGWNDERIYKEVSAKLDVLSRYVDEYIVEESEDKLMSSINNKKVFIVHGRNTSVRNDVELFISRIGLEPIILCEQANKGMTIIEKIEANCDVSFSIVLYTGCDEGRLKGEVALNDRARQNVVFEHGYMVAHLGRANVVALTEEKIEIPGDMSGIIYISLQDTEWKQKVMKEMRAANLDFDWYKA